VDRGIGLPAPTGMPQLELQCFFFFSVTFLFLQAFQLSSQGFGFFFIFLISDAYFSSLLLNKISACFLLHLLFSLTESNRGSL
jgi:hypothetical protein